MSTPSKISQLESAVALTGTEVIEILQGSPLDNKKLLLSLVPGKVWSVNNKVGAVNLVAADVGADATGTAASAISTHTSAGDPHSQYLTTTRGDARYMRLDAALVASVNGQTGEVTLTAASVGADAAGTAQGLITTHAAGGDPHTQYYNQTRGDARYMRLDAVLVSSVNGQSGAVTITLEDLEGEAAGTAQGLMAAHTGSANPHNQYVLREDLDAEFLSMNEVGVAGGAASLDESGRVPMSQLPNLPAGRKVTVANQAARLALPVYADLTIAYQTDDGSTWALDAGANPATSALWTPLGNALAGTVNSFKGRAGNVVPESGDYTADLITETATRKFASPTEKATWNGKVGTVNGKSGATITLTATDVGAEASGAATTSMAAHLSATDPHTQYYNQTRADARYMRLDAILVSSVNGKSGTVVLSATDVGADAAGAGAAAVTAHIAVADPHTQYLNTTRGDARYALKTESGVTSVNGKTGTVALAAADVGAQATLVSGTNIKTLGGVSLLGAGNIVLPTGDVTLTGTETLTNKTLTAPVVNGATLGGATKYAKTAIAAAAIDCAQGNYFTKSVSANVAFTFSNVPASVAYIATVKVVHTGGTITWPASVKWSDGTAPELTVGKTHLFVFLTDDGGVTWQGGAKANY